MRWILFIIFYPTLVLGFSKTTETNCSSMDLRNETLGEVRDQGKISWCYAFAGADMLAYTLNLNRPISAADIAISYNNTGLARLMSFLLGGKDDLPYQTGFNKIALNRIIKEGICSEDIFPSETWIKVEGGKEIEVPMPQAMREIYHLFSFIKKFSPTHLPFYYRFKNVDEEKFSQLIRQKNLRKFYSQLRLEICQSDKFAISSKLSAKMIFRHKFIFNDVARILESGNLLGIDYDASLLSNHLNSKRSIKDLHTSILVARRWNLDRAQCEYLIRNSHGPSCEKYDPYFSCEKGHIWVGESELYKNLTSLVFLDSKAL